MRKEDREKTAFVTEQGLFHYNCLSFGLTNAPSIFTQCMAKLLNGVSEFAIVYLDDIICSSSDFASHLTPPTSVKGFRSLIRMTFYYRRYIPDYAKIAYPLTRLTQKHVPFELNDEKQKSFEQLKDALINPPVLAIPQCFSSSRRGWTR